MKLRWKLLALLWLLALVPLTVSAWLDYRRTAAMVESISERNHGMLVDGAVETLERITGFHAARLDLGESTGELLTQRLAAESEARLAAPVPEAVPVVFASQFDDAVRRPASARVHERYRMAQRDGGSEPLLVSFEEASFRVPPGVDLVSVYDDLARLSDISTLMRALYADYGDVILWMTVTLENGLHLVYPGHGSYPPDFDPRARQWYLDQKREPDLQWSPPYVDVGTREIIWSITVPLRDREDRFVGVAALDVPLVAVFGNAAIPDAWREHAELMLLQPAADGRELEIAARRAPAERGGDWQTRIAPEMLEGGDAAHALLEQARREGRTVTAELPFRGAPALWSMMPFGDWDLSLAVIVPRAVVTADAARTTAFAEGVLDRHLRIIVGIVAAITLLTVGAAWLGAAALTRPLGRLTRVAEAIAAGDVDARAEVATGDELQRLADSFNAMVPRLNEHVRMKESLALAREVQQRLLPSAPPHVPGIELAGISHYCDETGGDYFDFFEAGLGDRQGLAVVIGDVSGHGTSAALLMTAARALLRTGIDTRNPPAQTTGRINDFLAGDRIAGQFMTLFFAVVDLQQRQLVWINAGHPPGLLYRPASDSFEALAGSDIPLGVEAGWRYGQNLLAGLAPGDVLLLVTDGVLEARAETGEPFGEARLRALLREHRNASAEAICAAVMQAVEDHAGRQPQADDITLAAMRFK